MDVQTPEARMTKNDQIGDFLQYYFDLPAPPEYAVMLKGRWGTGKTFFVTKKLVSLLGDTRKLLYVSLNGVASKKEIEDEFFRQMHPILASKSMRLAGRLLTGTLKATVKFDFDSDGREDGSATAGIPSLDLSKYLDSPGGLILIFDDLERCEIKTPEILGYINYFVEHSGCKVLIVANESEIIEREKTNPQQHASYQRIREKLIGKTFEIEPDLGAAIGAFLRELPHGAAHICVETSSDLIRDLYLASEYQNLRHLRQAILDFARLVEAIDPSLRNEEMLRSILGSFLIYSFEIRSGNLLPEEIVGLTQSWMYAALKTGNESKLAVLRKKYVMFDGFDSVFPESLWAEMLETGLVQKEQVNEAVRQSKYYAKDQDRPDWLRLWDAFELEDQALAQLLEDVLERLRGCEYDSVGVLKHIAGALLELSASGISQISAAEIVTLAKTNVDAMKMRGQLPLTESISEVLTRTGWAGRGFHGANLLEFAELARYIYDATALARNESYPAVAQELIRLMESDPREFAKRLVLSNDPGNRYYKTPVLAHADVASFIDTLLKLEVPALSTVKSTFENRYEHFKTELADEKHWLEELVRHLEPKVVERKGRMTGFWLNLLREKASEAAASLEISPAMTRASG